VNSQTSQLAEMFDLKFGIYNSSKCYLGQITLFLLENGRYGHAQIRVFEC